MCAAQSNPTQSFGPYTWGFATDNTRADSVLEISPNINYTVSSESVSSQSKKKKKNLKITLNNIPYFVVIVIRFARAFPPPIDGCRVRFSSVRVHKNRIKIESKFACPTIQNKNVNTTHKKIYMTVLVVVVVVLVSRGLSFVVVVVLLNSVCRCCCCCFCCCCCSSNGVARLFRQCLRYRKIKNGTIGIYYYLKIFHIGLEEKFD